MLVEEAYFLSDKELDGLVHSVIIIFYVRIKCDII